LLGALLSVIVILILDRVQQAQGRYFLSPYMYGFVSCVLTMLVGYVGSLLGPPPPYEAIAPYTIRGAPAEKRP